MIVYLATKCTKSLKGDSHMSSFSTLRGSIVVLVGFLCISSTAFAQGNVPRVIRGQEIRRAPARVVIQQAHPRVVIRQATPQDNVALRYQQLQRRYPTPNGYNSMIWQDGLLQRAQREVTGSAPRAKSRLGAGVTLWLLDTFSEPVRGRRRQ
jgi:hypothetical protein